MRAKIISTAAFVRRRAERIERVGGVLALALALGVAAASLGLAEAAVRSTPPTAPALAPVVQPAVLLRPARDPGPPPPAWEGRDIDGDGAPDFANPTGEAPRGHDRFGDG